MLKLKVKSSKKNAKVEAFFSSLEDRFDALAERLSGMLAQEVFSEVSEGLPKGEEYGSIRKVLSLSSVRGLSSGARAYAVYTDPKRYPRKNKRDLKIDLDVLYVRPKKRSLLKVPQEIEVLRRFSPWPVDMIPFYPSKAQATIVVRRVSVSELAYVRQRRTEDARVWKELLAKQGVRSKILAKGLIPKKPDIVEDVVFSAIRLEFGTSKSKSKPLWRRAVRRVSQLGLRMALGRHIFDLLLDPYDRTWQTVLRLSSESISKGDVGMFTTFEKRIGL